MSIELKAPVFPESVADGQVATWHKSAGDAVKRDELIVEIETDKVVLEVVAPVDGVLEAIMKKEGEVVLGEEVIGRIAEGAAPSAKPSAKPSSTESTPATDTSEQPAEEPAAAATPEPAPAPEAAGEPAGEVRAGPAARRLAEQENIDLRQVTGTGRAGLITREDVAAHQGPGEGAPAPSVMGSAAPSALPSSTEGATAPATTAMERAGPTGERVERRVPMTRMRKRIAERLLDASRDTAMLTTFNEANMAPLMALRKKYREEFEKAHNGTRLGYMGMFVKACCEALKRFPAVNASIDGDDIVYHGYQDIGVAVSTDSGLVVPVLRDADFLSVADVEAQIRDFGLRARDGKLSIEEMTGGTFTITNGGVFGSLMSTPILNPPQTGILGMHRIQERPMAVDGEVVVLPMMYLALSYDHRLVDGKDAVQFLVAVKELIEDPARILLQL